MVISVFLRSTLPAFIAVLLMSGVAFAQTKSSDASTGDSGKSGRFSLSEAKSKETPLQQPSVSLASHTSHMNSESTGEDWGINAPLSLRPATPLPPGVLSIRNEGGWRTSRSGEDDDWTYLLDVEYGLVENHHLLFLLPVEIGDGRLEGNADITLGWHWKMVDEQDWMPAFAMRNFIRTPSGVDSSGVDYRWVGLFTKTLVPNKMRLHLNPFLTSINGNNDAPDNDDFLFGGAGDDEGVTLGNFAWGAAIGMDYKLTEMLLLVGDYRYESGRYEDTSDQHALELGFDWKVAEKQTFSFATEVGLDGDDTDTALGARISYEISF